MKHLPLITFIRMAKSFDGDWDSYDKETKVGYICSYRKVEKETFDMVEKYGSITAWYESGEGRLLNLEGL